MTRTQAIQNVIQASIPNATLRFDCGDECIDDGATVLIDGTETNVCVQYGSRSMRVNEWNATEKAEYHRCTSKSVDEIGAAIVKVLQT